MDRRSFIRAAGGVTGAGLLAGCVGGNGGSGTASEGSDDGKDTVTIGAIEPLSGPFVSWGEPHKSGLQYGVKEINENGGVLDGRKLKTVVQDTGGDPSKADSAFRKFVEQKDAVAVTGATNSDVGIRTSRTAQDLEVPNFLHMSGTNAAITPETTYTFRVGLLPAATSMKAQAQIAAEKGYETIGAIVGDFAWGHSVKEGIEENFPVDVNIQVAPIGADDFKSYLRKFDQDLEMLIATGHPPGSMTIPKQALQLGYSPETITGPGTPGRVVYKTMGKDITKGYTHPHNSDVYSEEYAKIGTAYGTATGKRFDTHVSYGYVTAKLIAAAIEEAGAADPKAIAEATRNIEFDTLFDRPITYTSHGELEDQVQIYSQFETGAPAYYSEGEWRFTELSRTEPLPGLPAEK